MAKLSQFELLNPFPIDFKGLKIIKPTLREIASSIGFLEFSRITHLLTLTDIEIHEFYEKNNVEIGDIEPFMFLLQNCTNLTFFLEIKLAFFTYLKKEVKCIPEGFLILGDTPKENVLIGREDFTEFQNILRQINMNYDDTDEREIITDNLKMKQKFMEKRKMLKQAKLKERQRQAENGEQIELADIVSAICVFGVGYNLMNVWDLTVYQLYNQFAKCQKKSAYEQGIQALLAGASKKDVHLTNWIKN